jgi:hypothetical protein
MFGIGYLDKKETSKKLFNNIVDMEFKEENGIVISIASSIFALYGH